MEFQSFYACALISHDHVIGSSLSAATAVAETSAIASLPGLHSIPINQIWQPFWLKLMDSKLICLIN